MPNNLLGTLNTLFSKKSYTEHSRGAKSVFLENHLYLLKNAGGTIIRTLLNHVLSQVMERSLVTLLNGWCAQGITTASSVLSEDRVVLFYSNKNYKWPFIGSNCSHLISKRGFSRFPTFLACWFMFICTEFHHINFLYIK